MCWAECKDKKDVCGWKANNCKRFGSKTVRPFEVGETEDVGLLPGVPTFRPKSPENDKFNNFVTIVICTATSMLKQVLAEITI